MFTWQVNTSPAIRARKRKTNWKARLSALQNNPLRQTRGNFGASDRNLTNGKRDAKTSKAAVIKALGLEQPSSLKRQTIGVEEEVQDIDDQIAFFTMPRGDVVLHDDDLFEGIADLV